MKTTFHVLISLLLAAALAGCGTSLEDAKGVQPDGTAFENALYAGYVELAQAEHREQDFADTSNFADRALSVASGRMVLPEPIANRELPGRAIPDLLAARARLVIALDQTARDKIPDQAAHAQVMFDCWMQEQEEDQQPRHIARCRSEFEDAMAAVEAALKPRIVEAPPPPPPPAPLPPLPGPYMVFFDFDSSEITPEAAAIIAEAAAGIQRSGALRAIVSGHTDRAGNVDYNMALSERRADAVNAALQDAGVPTDKIGVGYAGEGINLVNTEDGVREPTNRRGEILLQR